MSIIQPIKEKEHIAAIAELLGNKSPRDRLLFIMGIYSGMPLADLLSLRVRDVSEKGKAKAYITVNNERYVVNKSIKKEIESYVNDKKSQERLFPSRKGGGLNPITRQQAYNIIKSAASELELSNIGASSLRKTYGYFIYMQSGKSVQATKKALRHCRETDILRYIGIEESRDNAIEQLDFGLFD